MVPVVPVVLVLTTVPDDESAETIARTLVQEQLAACVNVLPPMISIYTWNGVVGRDTERQLVMKTTLAKVPALEARLKTLHEYELPEFIVLPITSGSEEYLAWIAVATS